MCYQSITNLSDMPYVDKFNAIAEQHHNQVAEFNKIHFIDMNHGSKSYLDMIQLASQSSENNHLIGLGWMTHLEGIDLYIIDKQPWPTSSSER